MRLPAVGDARYTLGEGPVWHAATGRLWWVDITPGRVWSRGPDGHAVLEREFDQMVGFAVPRERGGFVAGLRDGVAVVDADGSQRWLVTHGDGRAPAGFLAGERFNDGKCDAAGRLWAGSINLEFGSAPGTLWRIDPDGTVTAALEQVEFCNGLGWSPDGATFYLINSLTYELLAFDFDVAAGTLAGRRVLVEFERDAGMADGMTVDAEGGLWVARYGASAIDRYSPSGEFVERTTVTARQPTAVTFAGASLREVWVTTAAQFLDDEVLAAEPDNGSLLATADAGIAGLRPYLFAG